MAKIVLSNGFALNLDYINLNALYSAINVRYSSSIYIAEYGGGYADVFFGRGFQYDRYGEPIGGTVTGYEAVIAGRSGVLITGVSVPATSIVKAAKTVSNADDKRLVLGELQGNDTFMGSWGDDIFPATGGNDTLRGGLGQDRLSGGDGHDVFVFASAAETTVRGGDIIGDFGRGRDVIDISGIDADPTKRGDQKFEWIGGKRFAGDEGELRFAGGFVEGDRNGDQVADFRIKVSGVRSMREADFDL